jgi:hypothetical protein
MSFAPNEYLKPSLSEALRCRQHALKTFNADQFRLLPKDKFLFHVAFNVNWQAINPLSIEASLLQTLKYEINLLVRSTDLPSYHVSSETLNQYNRKRVVQFQHKYNDIKISFHDDNMGLINQLWQTYYKYYYNDPTTSGKKGAYNKTAMKESSYITNPYGFMGRVKQFFNYITIYQMSRHEYVSYKIINPLITHWGGNGLAYHSGDSHNFDLTLAYEAVLYGTGYVNDGQIEGFATSHYDWYPSPLGTEYPANAADYPAFPRTSSLAGNKVTSTAASAAAINASTNTNTRTTSGSLSGINVSASSTTATTATTGNLSNTNTSSNKLAGVKIPVGQTASSTVATPITTSTGSLAKTGATTTGTTVGTTTLTTGGTTGTKTNTTNTNYAQNGYVG